MTAARLNQQRGEGTGRESESLKARNSVLRRESQDAFTV